MRKGSQGKLRLFTLRKIPIPLNARDGGRDFYRLLDYFVYYFLDELHERHKTITFESILLPPFARDNIWSAVRSFLFPHLEHQGCNCLANLDIFCHS